MKDFITAEAGGFLNQLKEGIILLDQNLVITWANNSLYSLLKYSPEKIAGRQLSQLGAAPEDVLILSSSISTDIPVTVRILSLEGRAYRLEFSLSPILDQNSLLKGYIAVVRNVSDEKTRETRLRMELEKYKDIASAGADWLWEIDSAGTYLFVSEGITASLGYEPEDMFGRTPFDFMPGEEGERVAWEFTRIIREGAPLRNIVSRIVAKSGEERILVTSGTPVYSSDGSIKGYRGSDRDITEEVRTAEELKHSLTQTKQILEKLPVGVVLIDENKKVREINSTGCMITGRSREELVGETCHKLLCPALVGQCPILDKHQIIDRDERFVVHVDGSLRPVLKTVIPVRINSENLLLEVFTDMSELSSLRSTLEEKNRELKNALQDNQKSSRAADERLTREIRLREEVLVELARASAGVIGYTDMLEQGVMLEDNPDLIKGLRGFSDSIQGIMDDLNTNASECSKAKTLDTEVFRISSLISRLRGDCCKHLLETSTLQIEVDQSLKDVWSGPVRGLKRLLEMLLRRALKEPFPERVLLGVTRLTEDSRGSEVRFSITRYPDVTQDSPYPGEDTANLDDILQIPPECQELQKLLETEIEFLPGKTGGFTCWFTVSLTGMVQRKSDTRVTHKHIEQTAVAVVGVDKLMAELYRSMLKQLGFNSAAAYDPSAYISFIKNLSEDDVLLVLLDADSAADDQGIIESLTDRTGAGGPHLLRIITKHAVLPGDVSRYRRKGCAALLEKPVRVETLHRCAKELLAHLEGNADMITDYTLPPIESGFDPKNKPLGK